MAVAKEEQGPWSQLRRRKVVQWGLAYAAGAWTVLEALGFVGETFGWPFAVRQVATIVLALGLPIALVVAWYHGDRGEQRVTGAELTIITLLLALSGGLLWFYGQRPTVGSPAAVVPATAARAPQSDARPSIAVLPFENRSNLQDDAFFVDGIHDDILTQLSKVSALRVISRTSVQRFRGTTQPLRTIAADLGVATVLEGGVQRAGDRVRINVQLIDAATDHHVWAQTYDRELSAANIFAIQSEIAAAIAQSLQAALTPGEQARVGEVATQSLAAWEAYQLGRQRYARRSSEALREALEYFRQAIAADPQFALAHAAVAQARVVQAYYSDVRAARPLLEAAQAAAGRALELAPGLPEAHMVLANALHLRGQLRLAEVEYRRALALTPNIAQAHHWYSILLSDLGRDDERMEHARQASTLDPLSTIVRNNLGNALAEAGRYREAAAEFSRCIELDPAVPVPYAQMGLLHYRLGHLELAASWFGRATEVDPELPWPYSRLASLWLDLGEPARAEAVAREALRRGLDDSSLHESRLLVQLLRGARSRSDLERMLERDPRSVVALALLAEQDLANGRADAALARYASGYPELVVGPAQHVYRRNTHAAIDVAFVLSQAGRGEEAERLLADADRTLSSSLLWDRTPLFRILAARGNRAEALSTLRAEQRSGWRGPDWRYYRDLDPVLSSIRSDPGFRAIFAEIERDLASQKAALLARPAAAPPEVAASLR
jgi:TolB-like protein/Tfp pilus assembly protein PilF